MEMVIQVKIREMTKAGCSLLLQQTSLALILNWLSAPVHETFCYH
uniref:Uncharacterized protein n=1 Tax=Anguilla anguilla TaxID=7936 RepID=A0A0E9VQL3_ANGAN